MATEDSQDKGGAPRDGAAAPTASQPAAAPRVAQGVPDAVPGAGSGAQAAASAAPAAAAKPAAVAAAKPEAVGAVPAAKAAPAAPAPSTSPPKPQPVDEFDPLGWEVPLICKDCGKGFSVPYRHFHAGVVFHCPHCNGSWVPNTTIAKGTRRVFEEFWSARKRAREAFERGEPTLERAEFERRQAAELAAFNERLVRLAREMKPAGKLVRPKGLAAMFT